MGSPALFKANNVLLLKDNIEFFTGQFILSGDSDNPTSVAKSAPISSLYLRAGTSGVYFKTDNGSTTNWTLIAGSSVTDDPTAMTNTVATRLGYKQYLSGTNYNGGVSPTTTATSCTVARAAFVPYKMQGGEWRCKFNITMTRATGSSITDLTVTIVGVVFKNVASNNQAVSMSASNLSSDANIGHAAVVNNTNTLFGAFASNNILTLRVSGDVELDSIPTWAY